MSNEEVSVGTREERVERAAERLRELEASGVELSEILGGEAGTAFLREDCHGDLDIAHAAFALLHSPGSRGAG
jgi:hypothetical protein